MQALAFHACSPTHPRRDRDRDKLEERGRGQQGQEIDGKTPVVALAVIKANSLLIMAINGNDYLTGEDKKTRLAQCELYCMLLITSVSLTLLLDFTQFSGLSPHKSLKM